MHSRPLTLNQKLVLRELLRLSVENGFGCLYDLQPIAEKLKITEPLYDGNTETGILWDFGPRGSGMIFVHGHQWPETSAGISYDFHMMIENRCYLRPEERKEALARGIYA